MMKIIKGLLNKIKNANIFQKHKIIFYIINNTNKL